MDEQQFKQLSTKLDMIIKLLIMNVIEGKDIKYQVSILSSSGFQPKQIGEIIGKTPNHIRVILHGIRKEKSKSQIEEAIVEEQNEQNVNEKYD
jgi:hypothetical protein